MRRSTIANSNNEAHPSLSTTTSTDLNNQQQKRSLEDYGFSANLKRRRHLSPQNANIDLNCEQDPMSSPALRKKTRAKSKNQSILNSSTLDTSLETSSIVDNQTPRKTSSRHTSASYQQLNELSLPNWERMCPNIDQILSNKHTQSGVFAHEVQLVQQELEALLSMSIVRETILKDLHQPPTSNNDHLRSKIRKHQEAERVYSSKKLAKKPLPPLVNHAYQRQSNAAFLLDRQVTIAPVVGARIDRIWSDVNNYYHKISSNDISTVENLVEFHHQLERTLEQCQSQYHQTAEPSTLVEQLNQINYEPLVQLARAPAVISHYLDRTTLGTFQSKLYEHIGQTSPVYRTPISSPMHGRSLATNPDTKDHGASLRISPRLHPNEHANHRVGLFTLPNVKLEEDLEGSSSIKSKKKNKFVTSPSSAIKFQQRLQYVQNYLVDQHLPSNDAVKRQLFSETKSAKRRKTSTSLPTSKTDDPAPDQCQTKLSTLMSLVHECVSLTSTALTRARLQAAHEEIWQKLSTNEQEITPFIEKLDTPNAYNNPNSTTEKAFESLAQLVTDWQKSEEEFDRQYKELFNSDQ